ncbi:hypothetical protein [Parendozoicomonas haliclonae]|uniref:Uncharacterized protein n=1 Tax=Parendozoicomonas haliclonae TaxID=1960125 RepID=A0A1X7AF19_9GAMM|nr:hypothetical protein [Parendozoicomonas haliclonae]SMA36383.1 hypothetical protein EHSB41UT_00635 [Parendozoicomonas haliclonae]
MKERTILSSDVLIGVTGPHDTDQQVGVLLNRGFYALAESDGFVEVFRCDLDKIFEPVVEDMKKGD